MIGVLLVAVHAMGFVWIEAKSEDELVVELHAPNSIEGAAPPRAQMHDEGTVLVHRTWSVAYRGGYVREVGASALAAPFQDPAAPPCSGRVVVGQALLDELASHMRDAIDRELRGEAIFPVGDYARIDGLALRWAGANADAPHGYVRATATVVFERARVPLEVALLPRIEGRQLRFQIQAHADLSFDNRVVQWLSNKLGAAKLATRLARRQIDDLLVTTLAPPPPFELPGGSSLEFTFCDQPVEIADGAYGALPFAVAIHGRDVPRLPSATPPLPAPGTRLAIELDLNALDAMLAELWRTGWLDARLAGLERHFNDDETVRDLLSVRIGPPKLALPPVVTASEKGLRLAADARLEIRDGETRTTGRVYGALDFTFAPPTKVIAVDLGALALSCERSPTTLVPCYGDLVAALRDRGGDFHGALTDAFAQLLAAIFVDRELGAPGLPASLVIHGARPALAAGMLRLELDAVLK